MMICQQLLAAVIAAATMTPALADTPPAATVEITAPRTAPAVPMPDIDGVFETETGVKLVVENYGDALNVRYGRRPAKILRMAANGDYVSADGKLSVHIDPEPARGPQTVRLTMPASWL